MAGRYKPYPEYKDSGTGWLEPIPSTWSVFRGKFVFSEYNERSAYGDETLLSVSEYYGVKPRGEVVDDGDFISRAESLVGYKKCNKNDLVMNIMLAWKRGLGVTKYNGIVSPAYSVFRFYKNALPDYMHYLLRTDIYVDHFKTRSTGVIDSRLRLYPESFADVSILLPSIEEQGRIANFLDQETAKIDTLIEKQQKLIQLLKEKRQAVISHAVTKGLNPNAKMKDSGVEWLGEVPEHWEVCLIKYRCEEITDGAHISPVTEDGERFFVSTVNIKNGIINFDEALLTTRDSFDYMVKTGCKPFAGDILFSKDGTIGQTAITPEDVEFVVASSLIIIRPNRESVIPLYFNFLLQSEIVIEQVKSFVKGAGLPRLSIQNLLKVGGVFPPIAEQNEIIKYLNTNLRRYDELEKVANFQVKLLQERRTALISAAVTGKIDVRDWQPPRSNQNNKEEAA